MLDQIHFAMFPENSPYVFVFYLFKSTGRETLSHIVPEQCFAGVISFPMANKTS